jgi:hypothetical protein
MLHEVYRSAWAGEDGGVVVPVAAVCEVAVADTDLGITGMQDIVPVRLAVHPPVEGGLGVAAASKDVFTDPRVAVALGGHTISGSRTIRTGVGDEIVASHIVTVNTRCGS